MPEAVGGQQITGKASRRIFSEAGEPSPLSGRPSGVNRNNTETPTMTRSAFALCLATAVSALAASACAAMTIDQSGQTLSGISTVSIGITNDRSPSGGAFGF